MIPPDAGYFERASARQLAQAHQSGATALSEVLAKAAKNGWIGNSRLILLLNDRLLAIYEVELREFGKFLFEAVGAVTSKSVASLRAHTQQSALISSTCTGNPHAIRCGRWLSRADAGRIQPLLDGDSL
jgi:hypothetical protein